MHRRSLLKHLWTGAALGGSSVLLSRSFSASSSEETAPSAVRGLPRLKITDVRTIMTAPNGIRLVVVKVLTSEPGLYGLGCATFTQRAGVVQTAVDQYLKPFLVGRDPDEIEDIWQSSYVSSYWRNGPVLFNAMSGIDMALWDIKGKRANMPLYQLLGGKCRFAADLYYHASGRDFQEVEDNIRKAMEAGYRYVRAQVAVPGLATYGARRTGRSAASSVTGPAESGPTSPVDVWEPGAYVRIVPRLFEHLRSKLGEEVELLHDVHERISPAQAVQLCKDLERFHLYFVEDPLPPEENDHFALLRRQTSVPIAMGELFNTQHEYVPLISNRLIDFIRIHISQIGGLSPARKIAALGEYFGVKTAWHGPGDVSPVGHAAGLALELSTYNFGVHEGYVFPPETREVFPGCPEVRNGYLYANEASGLGIDVDEKLAAKFPYPPGEPFDFNWGRTRRRDGTVIRP
jgi:mannonate dehydratase